MIAAVDNGIDGDHPRTAGRVQKLVGLGILDSERATASNYGLEFAILANQYNFGNVRCTDK